MPDRRIFLALPNYGPVEREHSFAVAEAARLKGVVARWMASSLLARTFNELWCEALNRREELGLTHFVMLHSDIAPESSWLEKLLDEMDRVRAHVLSAVSPIKDLTRTTSTGLYHCGRIDKFTHDELDALPCTFDGSRWPDKTLVVNTGLLAVDFREKWVEQCWFECVDRIAPLPNGKFEARSLPEDWNFSLQCQRLDRRVFATQIVGLTHYGRIGFERKAREVDS